MKKVLSILLVVAVVLSLSVVNVFAAGEIIGSMNGSVAAVGDEWGDHADGDSIKLDKSGDVLGYEFSNLSAGVYKIALYITVDELNDGRQLRVSPRVGGLRCWIDWATSEESRDPKPISTVMEEEDTDKIILVSVINVPENGMTVNVGWWQDNEAIVGTCDKVVLATADYDFSNDAEYTLVNEKTYRGNDEAKNEVTSFNEDAEQKLLPAEGSWTPSGSATDDGEGDINVGGDDNNENEGGDDVTPPATGDVSAMLALVAAGAAAFGGLKLKKK